MANEKISVKSVAKNKKAFHDYFVDDTFEAGISLFGTEVKSVREGKVNLKDSYVSVKSGEAILLGMHISPYEQGNIFNKDPFRVRKLLMHRKEIDRLFGKIKQDGLTLIPLSVYFKNSKVKVEVGLCKGKNLHDKRETLAKKQAQRDIDRTLKERSR